MMGQHRRGDHHLASSVLVYRRSATDAGFDVALELSGDDPLASPLLRGFTVATAHLFDH